MLLVPLLVAGQCQLTSPGGFAGLERELRANERKWARTAPAAYRLVQHRECECLPGMGGTMLVGVHGTVVVSVRHAESGEPVAPQFRDNYHSVEDLFALIREAIDRRVADLQVTYHATLGHPTIIAVDYSHPAVDDEVTYRVTSLTPLD